MCVDHYVVILILPVYLIKGISVHSLSVFWYKYKQSHNVQSRQVFSPGEWEERDSKIFADAAIVFCTKLQ